jgi:hypothetical protein
MKNILLNYASAAGLGDAFNIAGKTAGGSYNTGRDFNMVLGDAVLLVLSAIGVVFIVFMIYAGYLWTTANGNDQKVEKAKDILKESIIGLVVVVGAYAIAYFIINIFGSHVNIK